MDSSFWHDRWATQQIAFHMHEPNPLLIAHAALFGGPGRVLVPLCGKTHDLAWLAAQGHEVVGVELSELAARAFFAEQQLSAAETQHGPFKRFSAGSIEILCGDFFALEVAHAGQVTAVYDRAALIALPKPMRERYAKHVQGLAPGVPILLITIEHAGSGEVGPPFSVASDEVHALYGARYAIAELTREDVLESEPRFKSRGIPALYEVVYGLRATPG